MSLVLKVGLSACLLLSNFRGGDDVSMAFPCLEAGSAFLLGQGFREGKINVRQSLVFVLKDQHQRGMEPFHRGK